MSEITLQQAFSLHHCTQCGIAYAFPAEFEARLRNSHATFFCPNGHSQFYPGETEAEKYRRLLGQEQTNRILLQNQLSDEQRESARLRKRIGNGTCPCCKRSFASLSRHMKTKHPNFKELPSGERKLLTA